MWCLGVNVWFVVFRDINVVRHIQKIDCQYYLLLMNVQSYVKHLFAVDCLLEFQNPDESSIQARLIHKANFYLSEVTCLQSVCNL